MTDHDEIKVYYQEVKDCVSCPNINGDFVMLCSWNECPLPTLSEVEGLLKYVDKDNNLKVCGNCRHWSYGGFSHEHKKDKGFCDSYEEVFCCDSVACDNFTSVSGDD